MGNVRSAGGMLVLMRQPGIGPGTAPALAEHFPTVGALAASLPAERRAVAGSRGVDIDVTLVDSERAEAAASAIIGWGGEFRARPRAITSPPAVLWMFGMLPDPDVLSVTTVGTRSPTSFGVLVAGGSVEVLK
jgi:predicted Rossmann fold nucleotide-binding protein DprA/Smf involved in DNA uptake